MSTESRKGEMVPTSYLSGDDAKYFAVIQHSIGFLEGLAIGVRFFMASEREEIALLLEAKAAELQKAMR